MTDKDPNSTLVTFLLDRSGSMGSIRDATIEAFNAYLATLQEERGAQISFTFLQFDTESLDKVCVGTPVGEVSLLTHDTFVPRGGTPLIDAAVKTIKATREAALKAGGTPRIVVCIQTDGFENSSTEHTREELQALVAECEAKGWQFNYMGAGIDAYAQGAALGIGALSTMSYDQTDLRATKSAFRASAENARLYASGARSDTSYSLGQRNLAGDRFVPEDLRQGFSAPAKRRKTAPVEPTEDELMRAKREAARRAKAGTPMPVPVWKIDQPSPAPRTRRKTVTDFSL